LAQPMITAPRGVLFDFGGTLLREGPVNLEAGAVAVLALARDRAACTPAELAAAMTEVMNDLEPRRRTALLEPPPAAIGRLVYGPRGIAFDVQPEDVEWAFWSAATAWELEPGINAAIEALERANIPWAVLSNSMFRGQTIERQLALSGLRGTHRFVMASAEYVLRKPHPRLFAIAAARLMEPPRSLWFIGDSHEDDVCGSSAAGFVPFWYCPRGAMGAAAPAVQIIGDWAEFPELLAVALERS